MSDKRTWYWIYGKHAVVSAIKHNPNRCLELLITESAKKQIENEYGLTLEGNKQGFKLTVTTTEAILMLLNRDSVHQGIALKVKCLDRIHIEDHLSLLQNEGVTRSTLVICDQITDPHNFGAIIRSAGAFGINGVIIASKNQATESGVVAKASAGALEFVKIIEVVNISDSIKTLKKYGYWIVGLDASGADNISIINKFDKVVIILGAEDTGMRQLTHKNCDVIAKIGMPSSMVESLNVSNSAAIAFYTRAAN